MNENELRKDFPALAKHPHIIYLDSACTSLKPKQVIDAEIAYYTEYAACAGRSAHQLARKTNERLDMALTNVANFVGGDEEGLVWTKNTTEAFNVLINAFDFSQRKKVVTTVFEHHSVLLPLLKLRDEGKIQLSILPGTPDGIVDESVWSNAIDKSTALIITNNGNNNSGVKQDIAKIARIAHDNGAKMAVDGAQGVAHSKTDMKRDGLDFLCFSGHKMLGPTGIGCLVVRKGLLSELDEFLVGGGTVKLVKLDKVEYANDRTRFEAGVQNYAGIFGLSAACDYLRKIGMENVEAHEEKIGKLLLEQLTMAGVSVYGKKEGRHAALFTFNFKAAKAHDVGLMLDKHNIAVRSGFFCAQPALEALGAKEGAVRVSGYIYTTQEEVKKFGDVLKKLSALYG